MSEYEYVFECEYEYEDEYDWQKIDKAWCQVARMGNRRLDGSLLPLTSPPVAQILHSRQQAEQLSQKEKR